MLKQILRTASLFVLTFTICVMSVSPAMAESWTTCMEHKIINTFGSEAANCVQGFEKGDLSKIASCIEAIAVDEEPEVIIADLILWSGECAF